MLGAKSNKVADGWIVATLDVPPQKLAALAEAEGVDGGRGRKDWVHGDVGTGFGNLLGHVAEEGGGTIAAAVIVHADKIDERAGVDGVGKGADFAEAGGRVAVS